MLLVKKKFYIVKTKIEYRIYDIRVTFQILFNNDC